MTDQSPLTTPDGRYIVVRSRLWRRSNPALADEERQAFVNRLMDARRAVAAAKRVNSGDDEAAARAEVHEAKVALGERGVVSWSDGSPDLNRHMIQNTPYADWYAALAGDGRS